MKRSFNSFMRSALALDHFHFKGVSTIRKSAIQVLLVLTLLAWISVPDAAAFGLATISITDSSVVEGDSGTTDMVFTVTRSGDMTSAVEVGYTTADGTALAGIDYTAETGTVTIPSGETSTTINIPVLGNTIPQVDRAFSVQLTGVVNTYGPPVSFTAKQDFITGDYPVAVEIGDLNGDGRPDIANVNRSSSTISVFLNTTTPGAATPSFGAKQDFGTDFSPPEMTLGDFNNDGRPDLASANNASTNISVLVNTTATGATTPTFAVKQNFTTGPSPYSVAAADFNGDGKLDLASANASTTSPAFSVLLNTTEPGASTLTFAAKQDFSSGYSPYFVTVEDFNGDGRPDLASANSSTDTVSVLLNTTDAGADIPSFAAYQEFAAGDQPNGITSADFNGDGMPDLATVNYTSHSISVLLNTTLPGAATPSFATKQDFNTGGASNSVATADFNGDGKADLLSGNLGSSMSVLLNKTVPGAVTLSFATKQDFTSGSAHGVAAGDLNGDGKPDLVSANYNSDTLSVLLNTTALAEGPLAFTDQQSFGTGNYPISVSTDDFNSDGKADLASANFSSGTISVLLNTTAPGAGTATFAAKQDFSVGDEPRSVAVADLNGDGKPDLVSANMYSNNISVLLNTTTPGASTPTFAAKQDFGAGMDDEPRSVAVADLNGDGMLDLVTNWGFNTISVWLNTTAPGAGTATFAAKQDFGAADGWAAVAAADLNGDGKPDLVSANWVSNNISVLLNTTAPGAGTATFATKQDFGVGDRPGSVAAVDLNGDGMLDLASANNYSDSISVLLNTTAPGATTATFAAKQDFVVSDGPFFVAAADLNGDGMLDLATPNSGTDNISVLLNTTAPGAGIPTFAAKQDFGAGDAPASVAAADLNGDGMLDLANTNMSSNNISVLLNRVTAFTMSTATGTIMEDDWFRTYLPVVIR